MVDVPIRFNVSNFIRRLSSYNLTVEERGLLLVAWEMATESHHLQVRRFQELGASQPMKYIEHPMVVCQMLLDLGLGIVPGMVATLHDTVEDSTLSLSTIAAVIGGDLGVNTAWMVGVLSKDKSHPEAYYPGIVRATERDWRVAVVKLADRIHNLICPFGSDYPFNDREIRFLEETISDFAEMCHGCRPNIPDWFLAKYDELFLQTQLLAHLRLRELRV